MGRPRQVVTKGVRFVPDARRPALAGRYCAAVPLRGPQRAQRAPGRRMEKKKPPLSRWLDIVCQAGDVRPSARMARRCGRPSNAAGRRAPAVRPIGSLRLHARKGSEAGLAGARRNVPSPPRARHATDCAGCPVRTRARGHAGRDRAFSCTACCGRCRERAPPASCCIPCWPGRT